MRNRSERGLRRRLALVARLRMRREAVDVDRLLAAGVDPASSVELELRASRVTERRRLLRSASGLDSLVECLDARGDAAFDSVENVYPDTIRDARPALVALSDRLRENAVVCPRGAAMVSYLVGCEESPLYAESAGRRLRNFARDAIEVIEAGRQAGRC